MELQHLLHQTAQSIKEHVSVGEFHPGKFSIWLKFVHLESGEGGTVNEVTVGHPQKLVFTAASVDELVEQVAENMVLAVFGAEIQTVKEMPNLIAKLIDAKGYVPVEGAPPLDQAGQIYLKATVYRFEPSLWERIFGRKQDQEN